MDEKSKSSIFAVLSVVLSIISFVMLSVYVLFTSCFGYCPFHFFEAPGFVIFLLIVILLLIGITFGVISIIRKNYSGVLGIIFCVVISLWLIGALIDNSKAPYKIPEPDAPVATTSDPLTMSRSFVILGGYYNTVLNTAVFSTYDISNISLLIVCPEPSIKFESDKKSIPGNFSTQFTFDLSIDTRDMQKDKYVCVLCLNNGLNECSTEFFNYEFILEVVD